jgi:hypothetical protein
MDDRMLTGPGEDADLDDLIYGDDVLEDDHGEGESSDTYADSDAYEEEGELEDLSLSTWIDVTGDDADQDEEDQDEEDDFDVEVEDGDIDDSGYDLEELDEDIDDLYGDDDDDEDEDDEDESFYEDEYNF